MKNKKHSAILSIVASTIIGFITIFILSKTIDWNNKSATNNPIDTVSQINDTTNANLFDATQNNQSDSIKYLNETIIEIRKELEELRQQKSNLSKQKEIVTKYVSQPDTTEVSIDIEPQKLDTSTLKQIENDTIND